MVNSNSTVLSNNYYRTKHNVLQAKLSVPHSCYFCTEQMLKGARDCSVFNKRRSCCHKKHHFETVCLIKKRDIAWQGNIAANLPVKVAHVNTHMDDLLEVADENTPVPFYCYCCADEGG